MSEFQKLFQWFHLLLHHSQAGTLPVLPASGNATLPVAPVPAPPVEPAAPVEIVNAAKTGTNTGAVPGGDTPDSQGAIAIPSIAAKWAPNSRFLTVAALPYVPARSKAAFQIAENCGNSTFSQNIAGIAESFALQAVDNPPATVAVGGPLFHLSGQVPGEAQVELVNVVTIPLTLTTIDEITAFYAKVPDYGTQKPGTGMI